MSVNPNNDEGKRQCINCKEVKPLHTIFFNKDRTRQRGYMYKCKRCEKDRKDKRKDRWANKTPEQRGRQRIYQSEPEIRASLRLLCYRNRDAKAGRATDITYEYVLSSLLSKCNYCGHPSDGLDRLDNSIGHTMDNCVPCCNDCNVARSDHFTPEEMKIIGEAIKVVKDARPPGTPFLDI